MNQRFFEFEYSCYYSLYVVYLSTSELQRLCILACVLLYSQINHIVYACIFGVAGVGPTVYDKTGKSLSVPFDLGANSEAVGSSSGQMA